MRTRSKAMRNRYRQNVNQPPGDDGVSAHDAFRVPLWSVFDTPKKINWPADSETRLQTQLQQIKITSKPQVVPRKTTLPIQSSVPSRTTPQPVKRIRITRIPGQGTAAHTVCVQFYRRPSDPYFQSCNIYLQSGRDNNPVLVAGGSQSPISFSVAKSSVPSTVIVTSLGPGGETTLSSSPSAVVKLAE